METMDKAGIESGKLNRSIDNINDSVDFIKKTININYNFSNLLKRIDDSDKDMDVDDPKPKYEDSIIGSLREIITNIERMNNMLFESTQNLENLFVSSDEQPEEAPEDNEGIEYEWYHGRLNYLIQIINLKLDNLEALADNNYEFSHRINEMDVVAKGEIQRKDEMSVVDELVLIEKRLENIAELLNASTENLENVLEVPHTAIGE